MAAYCCPDIKIDKKASGMSWSDSVWKKWLVIALLLVILMAGGFYASCRFEGVHADASPDNWQQLHETLLADPASIRGHWLRTLNPLVKNVQGDLVWNSPQQQGVMRIRDLPDPKAGMLYQLWLYDARSTTVEPVSGGVLRSGAGEDELYAPITAASAVQEPYKFVLKLQSREGDAGGQVLLMVQP